MTSNHATIATVAILTLNVRLYSEGMKVAVLAPERPPTRLSAPITPSDCSQVGRLTLKKTPKGIYLRGTPLSPFHAPWLHNSFSPHPPCLRSLSHSFFLD
ncbi:hypothetical protein E2C01_045127 [Portunus trituberculatus]|uniref:Uncharacterized protein n=1 Tax=Portunus trituberculatus TaxID=210409 RepID=A0A5B7G1Z2_PORTR|nr:hypothetical protein [Portunus trituberculatus]